MKKLIKKKSKKQLNIIHLYAWESSGGGNTNCTNNGICCGNGKCCGNT